MCRATTVLRPGDCGTRGRSHTTDFSLDGSHRISGPLDGSHQRNPFHRRRWIPGGGNQCVADKYSRSGIAGLAGSADKCGPDAFHSQVGCGSVRAHGNSLETMGKGDCRPSVVCPSFWRALPCFCWPGRPRGSIRVSRQETGSRSRRNRFKRFTPSNGWIGPVSFIPCALLWNSQTNPLRKLMRDGMPSIVSPNSLQAILVAPVSFPSQRLRRATAPPSRTSRGKPVDRF